MIGITRLDCDLLARSCLEFGRRWADLEPAWLILANYDGFPLKAI